MKIAVVISVVGAVKRGGESTTLGLVSHLERHMDVHVLAGGAFEASHVTNLGFPPLPGYAALYDRLPASLQKWIRRFHYDPLSVRNLLFCRKVYPLLLEDLPDLVLFRSVGPWGIKTGRRLRALTGVPIVTIEGGWKKGEREVARYHPNLHIAVNVDVAEYLKQQLPTVTIQCLPNGIDASRFDPNGPHAHLDLPRPIYLGCGDLSGVKRFDLAIEAVRRLEKGSLLLLGKGRDEARLRQMGEAALGPRFLITSVPHEKMEDYYRAADVITVPSSGESFGMVYLEAMACNKPVVATRDRNRELIVGDGGELVDPTDVAAYSRALQKAAETSYDERPLRQARKFDWQALGPRYLEALQQTVALAHKGPTKFPIYRNMGG